jgi:ribonuclease HII
MSRSIQPPHPPLRAWFRSSDTVEAGVDEAGRGTLFGPVFAAAVVWNPHLEAQLDCEQDKKFLQRIRDSKKLSRRARAELKPWIEAHALAYGVGSADAERVDRINVLQATQEAMHQALDQIPFDVDLIVVDGTYFRTYLNPSGNFVPHACVVDADAKCVSVAAASILAKEYHDAWIQNILEQSPNLKRYGLERNMGYGTSEHLAALARYGMSPFHRVTFRSKATTTTTTTTL